LGSAALPNYCCQHVLLWPANFVIRIRALIITFSHNGENMGTAFSDVYAGVYFPSLSIYRSATVSVNFGPTFQHPPTDVPDWKPVTVHIYFFPNSPLL
uniref:COesterase domain-containing protein n=1 Tax=Echinostoma caproni TaxID=27848 RepID=A0A183BGL2_9TREM